jgi:ribonuclease-3
MAELEELESRLGYRFGDQALLLRALTHRSRVFEVEPPGPPPADNEQLEFLGDSVLGFVVSDLLVRRFPEYAEGSLTRLRIHLVNRVRLYEAALALDLGAFLVLGRSEEHSGGRAKRALLANAFEAILGSVYLDGGLESVRGVIDRHVVGDLDLPAIERDPALADPKTALQELVQRRHLAMPHYKVAVEHGPIHARVFVVEVKVGGIVERGEGTSIKSAGRAAAQRAYQRLLEELVEEEP